MTQRGPVDLSSAIEASEQMFREEQAAQDQAEPSVQEPQRGVRRNQSRSAVYSVRLNPEEVVQLELLASQRGIRSSALVRGWILQGLAAAGAVQDSPAAAVERMAAELETLRTWATRARDE
jgi:hypothetical protein